MDDDLRPPGAVTLECDTCGWQSWHDPLSDVVTAASERGYVCDNCKENPTVGFKCTACNRPSSKPHLEMVAEHDHYAHHCAECLAAGVPYHEFAEVIWCWSNADIAPTPLDTCPNIATHEIVRERDCSCTACWQTTYHACDAHREDLKEFFHAVLVRPLPKILS